MTATDRPVEIVRETDGPIAIVRLDRDEKLNAFTYGMISAIRAAVDAAVADRDVVGIVITGSGRAFSAGLDMGDLGRTSRAEAGPSAAAADTAPNPAHGSIPA